MRNLKVAAVYQIIGWIKGKHSLFIYKKLRIMKGIVLCGGQSLRMGKDKGLLIGSRKITWAQQAFSLLSKFEVEVALSINHHQFSTYKRVFFSHNLIPDQKSLNVKGPLTGILSAHLFYPKEDLMVLACDMIEMKLEVMMMLYNQYQLHPGFDAYVFRARSLQEPLCAIYSAKGLRKIAEKVKKQQMEKPSMLYALDQMQVMYLPINDEYRKAFLNMNTVSDLQYV